jgi:hypothetical protein
MRASTGPGPLTRVLVACKIEDEKAGLKSSYTTFRQGSTTVIAFRIKKLLWSDQNGPPAQR